MPRKSDTAERVLEVADKLLQQGVRPTQQNVRAQLGSGSISTINKALNEWWQQLGQRIAENQSRPDLPEPVVESANRLWQQALGYAEHSFKERKLEMDRYFDEVSRKAQQDREENLRELTELRAQNARLLSGRENHGDEKQALQQQIHALEGRLIRLTSEKENLERELKQQAIVMDGMAAPQAVSDSQELIELKVSLRLAEEERARQEKAIEELADENARLKKQILAEERNAISKRHALETVIAQQDVRYDQALRDLAQCREQLADLKTQ